MNRNLHSSLVASMLLAATSPMRAPAPAPQPEPQPIGVEPLNLLQRYPANTVGRDFVVGDLHGCYDLFEKLLAAIGFDKTKDRMFSVGDLGDRGPDSLKCLALLDEPWFKAVAGNHEQMLMDAACRPNFDWSYWIANGGAWAKTITQGELMDLAVKVAELPLCIVVGDGADRFNVIHAEFHGPDEALEDALEDITTGHPVPLSLSWGRDLIAGKVDPALHDGLSLTFVGHTPVDEVGRVGSHVYLDTGAFLSYRPSGPNPAHGLTAVEPRTGAMYHVKPEAQAIAA